MLSKMSADGEWKSFRDEQYNKLLRATAWTWIKIIESQMNAPPDLLGSKELHKAYYRTIIVLPQLPMEGGNNDRRYENSRWRYIDVNPVRTKNLHCEHPWAKKTTKNFVLNYVVSALKMKLDIEEIMSGVAKIIDARQDTLLLPSEDIKLYGVLSENKADGLIGRYTSLIDDGKLIDRATGSIVTHEMVKEVEDKISSTILSVISTVNMQKDVAQKRGKDMVKLLLGTENLTQM